MAKGVKHYLRNGTEWTGSTHKMSDGTLHTGKTHTKNSKKLFHFKDLSETAKKKARPSKRVGGPIQNMKKGTKVTAKKKKKKKSGPTPNNPSLYARVKAEAKRKFDVYPSAYANAWLVRTYKKRGGGYK
tara:strand:+ start:1348 stop:1734 length:387 start_codon:yes stop_codon:yes gene_type:complete